MKILDGRNPSAIPCCIDLDTEELEVIQTWRDDCSQTIIKCIKHNGYFVPFVETEDGIPVMCANYKHLASFNKWRERMYVGAVFVE